MSECRPAQRHPTSHSSHTSQYRGGTKNDFSVLCDVAAVVENLNNEQWMAVTGGMSNMERLDFIEICVDMISSLSKSAYQMFRPFVQILDTGTCQELEQSKVSPDIAASLKKSPLDTPLVYALCVEILHEVKGACLEAIRRIALCGAFTGSGDGLKARCAQLKEETVKVFNSRLDALALCSQKPDARGLADKKELKALKARDMTQQVVAAILNVIESSCVNHESVKVAAYLSHLVSSMIKVLASPETCDNKLLLGSYYSALKQVPPIRLTSDFKLKAFRAVLLVLLRSDNCPFGQSWFNPEPLKDAVLSHLLTAQTIVADIVDTVLEILVEASVNQERFCSYATKIYSRVQHEVKQFIILGKRTGLSEAEKILAPCCIDTVTTEPDSEPLTASGGRSQKPTTAASANAKELNDDVAEAAALLEDFTNSGEIHKFSLDLTNQVDLLLKKDMCQRFSCLPAGQNVSDTGLPSMQGGHTEADSSSVSLEFAYLFAEVSVKCFLRQLLYPSCPRKASDPDYFFQSSLSSKPCMAMAAHENCSGDTICCSQALREAVDLLRDIIMNQVMGNFSPEPAFPRVSQYTEDAADTTGRFEMTDSPHTQSTTENKRTLSLKQKCCILHKKYFSRRRNAVSPLMPNQACSLDSDALKLNHLQETFTSSGVLISDASAESGSRLQQMENACAPDTAAETPKKHNIFTTFLLSVTKSLRACFRKS